MALPIARQNNFKTSTLVDKPLVEHLQDLRQSLLISSGTVLLFFALIMFTWPEGPL